MKTIAAATLAILLLGSGAAAQAPAAPVPPPVSKNPADAPSGDYRIDPAHASVLARVAHRGGLSFSTFRLAVSGGTLRWNATDPAKSALDVTVDIGSIQTIVPGFANELIGERFLNAAKFPTATFASKRITRSGPTSGRIQGDLTFMGQTHPATIDAEMTGTTSVKGVPVIGFTGKLAFKRSDFGYTALIGPIGDEIELKLDVEFAKAGG